MLDDTAGTLQAPFGGPITPDSLGGVLFIDAGQSYLRVNNVHWIAGELTWWPPADDACPEGTRYAAGAQTTAPI